MSAAPAATVPVVEDLFEVAGDAVALLGSRCAGCGEHYFPRASTCPNPACPGGDLRRVAIGRRGRLYSWTHQAYQPPPLFAMEPWRPYTLGLVEIPEGLRVLAMLAAEPDELRVAQPMQLVTIPLSVDGNGRELLTYGYRPEVAR